MPTHIIETRAAKLALCLRSKARRGRASKPAKVRPPAPRRYQSRLHRRPAWASSWTRRPSQVSRSPGLKEIFQQRRTVAFVDAAINLGAVMACRRGEETNAVLDGTTLGIGGGKVKSANSSKRHCRRAHGARLQRDVQIAVRKSLASHRGRGRTNGDKLGMRSGVAVGDDAVAGPRNHAAIPHDDASNRHLAPRPRRTGFFKRGLHERRHGCRCCRARPCAGHPRLYTRSDIKDVDGRDKPARNEDLQWRIKQTNMW